MISEKLQVMVVIATMPMIAAGTASAAELKTFESGDAQTSLIELYTSEGCSSCPPAEKWLSTLKSNPDLWKKTIPIAFHVDYWDHLGWRDRFSKPEFTARQQAYSAGWGGDSVYTPGFVVNGKEWRNWFGGGGIPMSSEKIGNLRVTVGNDDKLTATFTALTRQPRTVTLNVALLGNDLDSDVKRGENSGHKLHHDFVVLSLATVEMKNEANRWTASSTLSKPSANDKPSALVAWITENMTPIQATGGWLR
jgi:hypothetical protein